LTAAAAIVANVGPAFGGDYADFPEATRWLLAAGMLFGRLEFFAVLVLFSPHVWGP
jgi:trk system potassium uptake protein TrkH